MQEYESEDQFISGIYNYCDRWCERCPFTARCRLFAMEQETFDSEESRDINNQAFWDSLGKVFEQTKQMLRDMAEQMGIDPETLDEDNEEYHKLAEERRRRAEREPVVMAAKKYIKLADRWFDANEETFEEKKDELVQQAMMDIDGLDPEGEAMKISDACEVVRWYQFQIAVKLTRALRHDPEDDWEEDEEVAAYDRNGSGKVALIGIDRSIAAWTILREGFPEQGDEILDILVHLERLRREVEKVLPSARSFQRPGFDTPKGMFEG